MENKIEVKVFRIEKMCPECEEGHMTTVSPSTQRYSHMNIHDHRCTKCGHPETYKELYPRMEYEDIKTKES